MKLGKIVYGYNMKYLVEREEDAIINLGDNIQTFGVEILYEMMGYNKNEIEEVNMYNFHDYSSDKIIVPMSAFFSSELGYKVIPTSECILPLFIGFHSHDETILDNIEYFKKYQPIGCRDQYTRDLLEERGIEAYISGCASILLPKRKKTPKEDKVFFVDTPNELEKYIPERIRQNSEYISHVINVNTLNYSEKERKMYDEIARNLVNRYKNEATLVVTSRLHCAVPCMAMGIPVILVRII